MSSILNIEDYSAWNLSDQLSFFDSKQYELIENLSESEKVAFLKSFILQPITNKYIAVKALDLFVDLALLGKLSHRQTLNLLIDETNNIDNTFLQIHRIKSLLLFYEQEPKTIGDLLKKLSDDSDVEIKSESLYSLGVIGFLDACREDDECQFQKKLSDSIDKFKLSYQSAENRVDSLFFYFISETVYNAKSSTGSAINMRMATELLWSYRFFSINDKSLIFKVKIYRVIFNLVKVINNKPDQWLQYKDEFKNISSLVCELQNEEIKDRLIQSSIIDNLKQKLTKGALEPYFRLNYKAIKSKIRYYLSKDGISMEDKDVLSYILSLTEDTDTDPDYELNECISNASNRLQITYPHTAPQRIKNLFLDVKCHNDILAATLKAVELFGVISYDNFHDKLMTALILLQGNITYKNKIENDRNTFLCNLLEMADLNVKDQTLWGSSNTGKTSGEIDIMVCDSSKQPFVIIEALTLDSLKQDYLKLHIDKIYKYDTSGLQNNVIIVYSEANNFFNFNKKYFNFISEHEYPHNQKYVETIDSGFSEIQIYKSVLDRNGKETNLFHYVVNIK